MSEKVVVVAADSAVPVPMESDGTRRIGIEPVQVELTHYYRRRIARGELALIEPQQVKE